MAVLCADDGLYRTCQRHPLGPAAFVERALDDGIEGLDLVATDENRFDLDVREAIVARIAEVDSAREERVDVFAYVVADDDFAVDRIGLWRERGGREADD